MCTTSAWVLWIHPGRCQAKVGSHVHPLKCNFHPRRKPACSTGTLRATWLDVNSPSEEINTAVSSTLELKPSVDGFNWYQQWYPVAVLADLDKTKPTAAKVLDTDIVIWWSPSRSWNIFHDRCPHRLAALSEGVSDTHVKRFILALLPCETHS